MGPTETGRTRAPVSAGRDGRRCGGAWRDSTGGKVLLAGWVTGWVTVVEGKESVVWSLVNVIHGSFCHVRGLFSSGIIVVSLWFK